MLVIWLGGLLFILGLLLLAGQSIWHGRMSGDALSRPTSTTLEPPRRGVRFLGLGRNMPGLALMVAGAILLLAGAML